MVILDAAAQTLQVNVTFSGLTSNAVAAHIHCCAPLGTNAGSPPWCPRLPVPPGSDLGTYTSPVFDLTDPLSYNPAFVTAQGACAGRVADLIGNSSGQIILTFTREFRRW